MEPKALSEMSEAEVLAFVGAQHDAQQAAEVNILRAAFQWAVIHNPDRLGPDAGKQGRLRAKTLGGPGTPAVTENAAAAFGARIGRSPYAAARLIGDALDLHLRLPELQGRVETGQVRVSYARYVADATRDLDEEAAGFVDAEVAEYADGRLPWSRFVTLIEGKVAAADPKAHAEKERRAAEATFAKKLPTDQHGMASFLARADLATITAIDTAVGELAAKLDEQLPDTTADERRVIALLILTNPAHIPNGVDLSEVDLKKLRPKVQLYLHGHTDTDTECDAEGEPVEGIIRVEGHGPVTWNWLRTMLGDKCNFHVTPVIDLAGQAPVDAYEIPDRHRRAVHLMTPADVFPYASNTSRRMEIDHTIPYSQGGPSAVGNYGPMTKHHHRIKTHDQWDLRQPWPGIYLWRDPYGTHYLVDHTGTRRVRNAA
jgi:hypothetical protein